ncbi:hypothetical protein HELRODRAFT_181103 [Helobdella robusta]|uniref:Rho-GAP domain-containing protein n=1 Tax=Helobdella robusta TaxID=6412 RepID=T1FGL9_HELRO|nr:hypothetical protein HELRODRAFT_181103 [Helobdella robusta]ESN93357.1 hypothetical protein HELRODRAFT_181103 [Helobdella robusta]
MCVLHKINVNSQINLMTSRNLSVCLSPSILRPSNSVGLSVEAKTIQQANNVVEWLIDSAVEVLGRKECIELFEEVTGHLHGLTEVCGEDSQEGFCTPMPRINTSFLNLKELEDFGKKLTRSNSCEQLDSKYLLPPTPSNFSNNIRASSLDNLDTRGVSQLKKTISPDSGISGSTDESDRKLIESPIFKKEKSLNDAVVQASDDLNRTKEEDDEVQILRCESETSEENDLDVPRIKSFYLNSNSKTKSVVDESNVKEVTDDDSKLSDGMIDIDDDEYFLVEKDLNDLHGGEKKSADISDRRGSQLTSEKKSDSSAITKYDTAKDTDSDNTMTKSSSFLTGVSLSRNTSIVECNSADTEVSIEDKFDEIERFFYSEPANSTPTDTKLFRNMTESKIIFDKILFPAEKIKSYDENANSKFKFQPNQTLEPLPQQQKNKHSPQGEPIQQKPSPKIELKLLELRANGIRKLSPTTNQQLYQEQPIHRQPQNHQPEAEEEPQTPAKLRPLTPNSSHQKLQRQQVERLDVSQNSGGSCLVSSSANVPLPSQASSSSLQAVHSSGDSFKCKNLRQLKQLQFSQQQHNQQQHQLHQQQHNQQPQQQRNQQRQSLLSLIESSHHRLVKSVSSNPGTVAANRNDKVQPGRYHTSMHIDNINNILNSNNNNINITNNAINSDNNTNSNRNISSIYGNRNIGNRDKINKYISSININSMMTDDDARCSSVSSDINYNRINNFYNINDNSYNTLNLGRRAKSPYIVEIDTGTPTKSLNELKLPQSKLAPSHAADRNDSFQKQVDRKALVLSGNRQLNGRFVNSDPSFMERQSASRPDQASFRNQDNGNGVGGVVMKNMEGGARKKFFRTSIQLGSFDTDYITYHDDIPVDDCSVQYRNQSQLQQYHPQLQRQPPAKVLHPEPNSRISQISHYVEDHRATPTFVNINNSLNNNNKLNNNNNTSYNNYNNNQSFQVVNWQTALNSRTKPPRTPNQIFTNDMKLFFSSEHEGVISGKRNDNSSMQLKRSGLWKSTFNL